MWNLVFRSCSVYTQNVNNNMAGNESESVAPILIFKQKYVESMLERKPKVMECVKNSRESDQTKTTFQNLVEAL